MIAIVALVGVVPAIAAGVEFGVACDTDLDQAAALLRAAAEANPAVQREVPVSIMLDGFADSALILKLLCLIADTPGGAGPVRAAVRGRPQFPRGWHRDSVSAARSDSEARQGARNMIRRLVAEAFGTFWPFLGGLIDGIAHRTLCLHRPGPFVVKGDRAASALRLPGPDGGGCSFGPPGAQQPGRFKPLGSTGHRRGLPDTRRWLPSAS